LSKVFPDESLFEEQRMRIHFSRYLYWVLLVSLIASWNAAAAPENVAPKAIISASGHFNAQYVAANLCDGIVPAAMGQNDAGRAWCVPKAEAEGAELTFSWPAPMAVTEVVYFGRTAFQWEENFRDYAVFIGDSAKPIAEGKLKKEHGPQRIRLPKGTKTASLRIRFLSHHGGTNPGASEIALYDRRPSKEQLAAFLEKAAPKSRSALYYEAHGAPLPFESSGLRTTAEAGALGFDQVLAIQRHAINSSHVYTYHCEDFRPGGRLCLVDMKGGVTTLVDAGAGQMLDCDLSYDGAEILFSWRKNGSDTYQVYRIQTDGTGLAQITTGPGIHNFNAAWLPDGDIVFLSTRKSAFAYCWNAPVGTLYRMNRNGAAVKRISANYLNDFTPAVLDDGRLAYGRWEYVDRPAIPIQGMWALHPDGTNLRTLFGNRAIDPGSFLYPHSIPGTEKILCLLTSHNGPCLGAIGVIDVRHGPNAQEAIRNITPEITIGRVDDGADLGNHIWTHHQKDPLYTTPYPVDDQYFLVTRAGALVLRDYDGTEQMSLSEPQNGMGFYDARPLMPRKRPPVLPSTLPSEAADVAYVYLRDIYAGLGEAVAPGEVHSVRVVQEIEKPVCVLPEKRAFGWQFPVVSCGATYAPKKVWGDVRVQPDGSAAFEVPAGLPIYFMALDAEGRAVQRMRSFTHLMPGESQGCIGCHEPRQQSGVAQNLPHAFSRPPQPLEPPEWGVVGFSYPHIVQPVLDTHCVSCHGPKDAPKGLDLSGDKTEFFNVSYEMLARMGTPSENSVEGASKLKEFSNPYTKWIPTYNGQEENVLEITPKYWGSHASKLAEVVASGHPDAQGKARIDLSLEERGRIYAWIDLNVPYYATSDANRMDARGCRYVEPGLDAALAEVAPRRCAGCHEKGNVPRRFFTRVTHAENDPLLLAPLARASGGTQACGQAVFADTQDPDYQKLRAAAQKAEKALGLNPRIDLSQNIR
jgi:hypothetical protein